MTALWVRENGFHVGPEAGTATDTLPLTSGATAGNMVVAIFASGTWGLPNNFTFSDSNGNTWQTHAAYDDFSTGACVVIGSTMQDVGTLTTSDTVTLTIDNSTTYNGKRMFWLEEFSGISTGTRLDKTSATATTSGTSLQTALLTPTANGDVAIAVNQHTPSGSTDTINASGTVGTYSSFTTASASTDSRTAWPVYQIISGGSGVSQRHRWTWSTSSSDNTYAFVLIKSEISAETADAPSVTPAAAANAPRGGVGAVVRGIGV